MKNVLFALIAALCWAACQNNPDPKATGTPTSNQPNPADMPQGLHQSEGSAMSDSVVISKSELVGMKQSVINGSKVSMHKEASSKSEKIATFGDQEKVGAIESQIVQSEVEAILIKPITVKGSRGTLNLPKGKSVIIEDFEPGRNTYLVHYNDSKKGKLSTQIDAKIIETFIYATWYKVQRKNGETGWVLGSNLKTN